MGKLNDYIKILKNKPFIQSLINDLKSDVYVVGGVVRDLILNKQNKDIDLVVGKVPINTLISQLQKFGKVDVVGKSFGVIKFIDVDGIDYDIALPRKEQPTGEGGYRGFDVQSDENLPIEDELIRRDAKMNAMAININTGKFIDPLGGLDDIKNKQISAANPEAFSDDPLRLIRFIQFASRFGFTIESQTMQLIQSNAQRIKEIPPERILTEFDKIVKKGNKRVGAQLLKDTGLFNQIFGFDINQSTIDRSPFEEAKTMGEFIYLLTRLLPNPAEFYKNNLKGDIDTFKEIKAFQMAFESSEATNLVEARSVAHNMYLIFQQSLQSQILPDVIKSAAQELLQGKYPKTVGELAINGNDLIALRLKGKEVGDTLKMMLLKIYSGKIRNNREDLLSLVGQKSSENLKEEVISYSSEDEMYDNERYDPEIAYEQAMQISKDNGVNILSDKELKGITLDNDGNVIGAFFESVDIEEYSFDVVVDKNYQGRGYGKELVQYGLDQYNYYKDAYGDKLKLNLDVVNPNMRNLLKKYFGFKDIQQTDVDRYSMTLKEEKQLEKIEYGALMLYLDIPVWSKITSVIKKEDIFDKPGFGIEDEPHLTILYGFHKEVTAGDVFELYKITTDLKPIEVRIKGISIFENPDFDVVKFDVNSKILTEINDTMRQLPNTTKFPEYHAHITLAYVKKGEGKKYVRPFEKERIIVGDKLIFSTKEGEKETLKLNEKGFLKEELEYHEVSDGNYRVNNEIVNIDFFIKKYDEWNNQGGEPGYKDPSQESVLEFFQNNYEDFSHNEKLKKELLMALTDREVLNERVLNEMSIQIIDYTDIITPEYIKELEISDNYERYVEDYQYEHNLVDVDKEEIEKTNDFKNWLTYELRTRFNDVIDNIKDKIKPDGIIDIWRRINVDDIWVNHLIQTGKHLGIYWSWDEHAAEAHWGDTAKKSDALIKSSINEKYIDWNNTIEANMNLALGEDEKEITLFKNTSLKIEELNIDGQEVEDVIGSDYELRLKNKTFYA